MRSLFDIIGDGAAAADPTDSNTGTVNTDAIQAAVADMLAHSTAADALSFGTDIYNQLVNYIDPLEAAGKHDIAQTATNYASALSDAINANIDDSGNLTGSISAVQAATSSANGLLKQIPGMLSGAGGITASGVPTITTIADANTGAASGAPGDAVTLTGTNFTGTTAVDFNGVPAQFQVVSATQLAATVPPGAASGPVHVTNGAGTGVSAFTVVPAASPYVDPGGGGFGGGSSGGGGFGDEGGDSGDPGGIDWGDGDAGPADRGGGGLDDVGPASADQGIDWGDDQSSDASALEQTATDDLSAPSSSAAEDPFASMLPDDQDVADQADDNESEDVMGSYLSGIDAVIGARTKQTVTGDEAHPPFDNTQIYHAGEVVTYWGQYWRATRDVLPPMFPSFMSGEVPGSSDAWKSLTADDVVNRVIGEALGADTIPQAGANYTDKKTVGGVQASLNDRGFGPLKVDGIMGPKTAAAIRKMQSAASMPATGIIDEGVIAALGVTPGVLPPGVTLQEKTAVEVQAAIDAATAVEHSVTPADLQAAAAQVVDAAPAAPPELKQEAQRAHTAVLLATTPAAQAAAKQQVQVVAQKVQAAVSPGWWSTPLWQGAPVNRMQGIVGGVGAVAIVAGVIAAVRR